MKIQINNAETLDLTIQDLYDCWLIDKESFHHWLTRKSNIKIPLEADTGTWFFSDKISGERVFAVDLKEYVEWWNPLVAYIRHIPVNSYEIVEESTVNIEFEIYLNNYPEGYWVDN
jgi:hypothetical protein